MAKMDAEFEREAMIKLFKNADQEDIGINPEHVVAVELADNNSPHMVIIHLVNGQQRGVMGTIKGIIDRLNDVEEYAS
jgi:hypothetical protein